MTSDAYREMEYLFDDLFEEQKLDFINHIKDVLEKRSLDEVPYYGHDDMDEEYSIDFGPFGAPKIMPDQAKPKAPSKPAKPAGKQLNLFDDEI